MHTTPDWGYPPLVPLASPRHAHLYRIPAERPILALDVSKTSLVGTYTDRRSTRQLNVPNTAAGIRQLLAHTPEHCCWVLEPTGRSSNLAVDQARAAGRDVLMAEPRRTKAFLRSSHVRAKADPLDSQGISEYAAARPLPLYPRPAPVLEQTQQLLSARRGLSQALTRLRQQQRELPHAAGVLDTACESLRAQLAAVDQELAALAADATHTEALGAVARLQAVPGIGPVTATAVNACLQRCRFTHPDQLVAYVGLDLTVRDSGRKQGKRQLTHRGDSELRRLLYLAAQANLRSAHSPFKQQYDREKAKGLPHTGAVCAVARKLAKVCWSLVKHGTKYDPARVHQQPAPTPGSSTESPTGSGMAATAGEDPPVVLNKPLDTEP